MDHAQEIVETDGHGVVLHADQVGGLTSLRQLIGPVVLPKPHGKSLHLVSRVSLREERHQRRIHAAAEQHAHLHITHELPLDGAFEQTPVLAEGFPVANRDLLGTGRHITKLADVDLPVFQSHPQAVAGSDLVDVPEQRVRCGQEPQTQQLGEAVAVNVVIDQRQERLQFGAEGQAAVPVPVVQRLDSEGVACQNELVVRHVQEAQREDAVEGFQCRYALCRHGVENGLRITMAAISRLPQIPAELQVVINLAIENQKVPAVRGLHRLPPRGRQVHDRQPTVAELNVV